MIIPFFTKPKWCVAKWKREDPEWDTCGFNIDFMDKVRLKEEEIDNDYKIVGFPSSQIPKLDPNTQAGIEIFCELILLYYTNSRLLTKRKTKGGPPSGKLPLEVTHQCEGTDKAITTQGNPLRRSRNQCTGTDGRSPVGGMLRTDHAGQQALIGKLAPAN